MGTIRLKRKSFAIPVMGILTGASVGLTGLQMKQSSDQAKESEAQSDAQQAAIDRQTKALKQVAKAAESNPIAAQQAAQVMQTSYSDTKSILSRKNFAAPAVGGLVQNAKGFGKDLWKTWGWNKDGGWVKDALKFGAAGAVLSYGANKWIQHDMKKEGIQMPGQQIQQPQQQQYSQSILSKNFADPAQGAAKETAKGGMGVMGKVGMGVMYGLEPGMSLLSYYGQKKQLKAQQQQTQQPQQVSYSAAGAIARGAKWIGGKAWNLATGMGLGTADKIKNIGETWSKSNSAWSRAAGNVMQKHSTAVAAAGVPVGFMAMGAAFDAGGKLCKKPIEMMDKNAYAWDKSQEEQVQ